MVIQMQNPFNPSFGKMPSIFLDRDSLSQRVISELNRGDSPFQTSLIYGQRGAGKTALMTDVANELKKQGWLVIDLILDDDFLTSLISQLQSHLAKVHLLKDIDVKVSLPGIQVDTKVANQNENSNFQTLFHALLEKFTSKGINVLITIDEVKATPLLRKLISSYQIMLRDNLNVSLLMAGLPDNVSEIQNDDVLTFLLRANRITLNPLDVESVKTTYKQIFTKAGFTIENDALLYMTKQTLGFAYAFQLLGYWVWNEASQLTVKKITIENIQNILDQYISDLNRNVYYKVYSELTPKERDFVQAMVKAGGAKVKMQTIAKIMKKNSNYVNVYRRKLLDEQVISTAGYGYVSFLLPHFDEFIEQQMILDEF